MVPTINKSSSGAKLWLTIFAIGYIALVIVCNALSAMVPATYGDLTRIGLVSERLFGWKQEQPSIADRFRAASKIADADVLVIGDSFSERLAWQATLAETGLKVATTMWTDNALCADLDRWLAEHEFKGKVVIAETVERYAPGRLRQAQKCSAKDLIKVPPLEPLRQPGAAYTLGVGAGVRTNILTLQNTKRAERAPFGMVLPSPVANPIFHVAVMNVADGCSRFSHTLCSKALFLTEDVETPQLTPADAEDMAKLTSQVKSAKLIWALVPNKTTVYLQPERAEEFRRAFNRMQLGPDLFQRASMGREAVRDLYWGNDTHWSTAGQLYFGETVRDWIR
ncbi:hypothetical protein EJP69_13525 [Variovorax gossypii]|uniref:AlgX/AlgJ SGNH hydrolase-like domain-containing protein n=1 Tax=Variovorax gossypii TaxID=1679495 RepID=A0A3S0HFY8_9BURK|nr:hypothetical protein [Variovorax gossypii]RTQ35390.1 hypothetical protein EJP69_13525 [Variovorax gossypii]